MPRDPLASLACRLHAAVLSVRSLPLTRPVHQQSLHQLLRLEHRYQLAKEHGWSLAASRLAGQLRHALDEAERQLGRRRRETIPSRPAPTIRMLLAELRQLEDEFGEVAWSGRDQELMVTTEAIELEGVYLGPFELRLCLAPAGSLPRAYPQLRVVAVEPCPAAGHAGVPHPHVSGNQLCAGDGAQPLREAAHDGRVSDLFTIARAVLETYNPGSAYASLDDWLGTICADCGERADDEGVSDCEQCGDSLCGDCTHWCHACDQPFCAWHCTSCSECDDTYCTTCAARSLSDGRCERCQPDEPEENDDDDEDEREACAPAELAAVAG